MSTLACCVMPESTVVPEEKAVPHTASWGYEGNNGPEHWGSLAPEYATCQSGVSQSPIDLTDNTQAQRHDLEFHYAPSPLEVFHNGHTLHIDYAPGSRLITGDQEYELLQFHFHHLSEHTIDGVPADMELHLVHRDTRGQLAVVGIFLTEGPQNEFLQRLWRNLPRQAGQKRLVEGDTGNITDMLPAEQAYFSYTGSLTTPPCTENINWFVFRSPVAVSAEQIAQFAELFPNNARPTQPLQGRTVYFSQM